MNAPSDRETELGGAMRSFPSTCWSQFLDDRDLARRKAAVEALARAYWKPVYVYIRLRWERSNEDAKDLTQDFFAWMIESDFLGRADPRRGRFRGFVKVALEHFLGGEERKRRTVKRGGDERILSLDIGGPPLDVSSAGGSPEQAMDALWRNELMARAAADLQAEARAEGREVAFFVFRDYHLAGAGEVTYKMMADRYGISSKDADHHLEHARKRFRFHIRKLVAETVGSDEDLQEELRSLLGEDR